MSLKQTLQYGNTDEVIDMLSEFQFKIDFIVWKFSNVILPLNPLSSLKQTLQYGNTIDEIVLKKAKESLKQTLQYGNTITSP